MIKIVSLLVCVALFAMIYRILPDVRISWRDVSAGTAITAALFAAGKFPPDLDLGRRSVASAYGAAGSLIVLLLWVCCAASILLFDAELTQVYTRSFGSGMGPEEYAEVVRRPGRRKNTPKPP